MNVLHLVISLSRGGRREAILRMVSDLRRLGVTCHVACVEELGCSLEEAAPFGNVEVLERRSPFDLDALEHLARLCREQRIDLIHSHDTTSQFGAAILRLAMPHLKVLTTFHRSLGIDTVGYRNRLRNALTGLLTNVIITASKERQEHYRSLTVVNPKKVIRIPLGIDAERFFPDPEDRAVQRRRLGIGPEVTLLGAVGHFGHEKGVDIVIRAYRELSSRHAPGSLALLVLGEGTPAQEQAMRELARGCAGREVIFGGFQPDTEHFFRAMDIFLHAPRLEAFGLVLTEAMSCGIPVVATRVGGAMDIVREGQTGLLVPSDDPVRMAHAVDALLASDERRASCGATARRVVLHEYTGTVCAQRHVQVYDDLLAGRSPKGLEGSAAPTGRRVLHVVESLEVGGLERLVSDLVMLRGPERTSVACLEVVGPFGEDLRRRGVDVRLIGIDKGSLSTLRGIYKTLRAVRPDVVHCHNMMALFFGGLGAALTGGIPLVMTKHGNAPPDAGKMGWPNRWLARHSQVIAVSEGVEALMSGWMKGRGRPVLYIPNGISMTPYQKLPDRKAARAGYQWQQDEFLIGIVARLAPNKGHDCLIEAFALFRKEIPASRLIIVGDGKLRSTIPEMIRTAALDGAVNMLGERPDVPMILATLDLFALPSEHEGMPVTVLEAMAAGLPVVASNVGGIPQVVVDGETGILLPPKEPVALAQTMLALARDPVRRQKMGELGKRRVHQQFALEQMAMGYENVYRSMLEEKARID